MRGFAGVIFRTHEKFPGILKTASKNFFFSEETPKGFFFFLNENKVIFRR